jgi:hypothetical protein
MVGHEKSAHLHIACPPGGVRKIARQAFSTVSPSFPNLDETITDTLKVWEFLPHSRSKLTYPRDVS